MTTNQILTLARAKLLEAGSEIFPDATLLIYLNLDYEDMYKRLFTNDSILTGTATFTAGSYTLASTVGTLYGAAFDAGNTRFEEVSIEDFDARTLSHMITIQGGAMKVYPTNTASLTFKYFPKPIPLTVSDNPTINSYFHEPLVYGTISRAHEDLQDEELATFYMNKREDMIKERLGHNSVYEETNQRGAQMFGQQDLLGGGAGLGLPNQI